MPTGSGVQVLPIIWRKPLPFEIRNEDSILPDLEDITIKTVPSLRMLASDLVVDILLYMTPRYKQDIVNTATSEMNRIFKLYSQLTGFNGRVSIFAHSLGTLIAFDISCNNGTEFENVIYPALDFKIDTLFQTGSPVGLFLLLRGETILKPVNSTKEIEDKSICIMKPKVGSLFNIYNPLDPVAYRIEPFFLRKFAALKPFELTYTKGGVTAGLTSLLDLHKQIESIGNQFFETITGKTSTKKDIVEVDEIAKFNRIGRLDCSLVAGMMDPSYVAAISAHSQYWVDKDVANFVLGELWQV